MNSCSRFVGVATAVVPSLVASLAGAQSIKADETTVDVTAISAESRDAARGLRMSFSHASVGGNIWDGLQALADADSDYEFPNWTENNRGNPGWEAKVTQFEEWVAEHSTEYDVFQNKFCYIDPDADFATYRDSMASLAEQYPEKVFVWWTIPLTTDDADNPTRGEFNQRVRAFCEDNDLPVFDLAAIESHRSDGTAVTSNGAEALDPDQSSDGGHLNELGASRAAQAQWALMAQIAGWERGSSHTPSAGSGGAQSTTGTGASEASDADGDDDKGCQFAPAPAIPGAGLLGWGLLSAVALRRRRKRCQTA